VSNLPRIFWEVVFWGCLLSLPLVVLAAVRSREPASDFADPTLTRSDRRWLVAIGTVLALEGIGAILLCLTIVGAILGWPWLWLSWSMLRAIDRLRRGGLPSPRLLHLQCLGVAIATGSVGAIVVANVGASRVDAAEAVWLLAGTVVVALHLRVAWITQPVRPPERVARSVGRVLL
jgi:hypothetical protein